ncbi:hypothetical protein SAMN04515620_1494 [Collimonas sp. OK607]|nr:hypothetical protein SAMN04515620_1494 [Collimonas sp. OK607]
MDCAKNLGELATLDMVINVCEMQMLWEMYSQRHASDGLKPVNGNAGAGSGAEDCQATGNTTN